jgi:hypothetical protein
MFEAWVPFLLLTGANAAYTSIMLENNVSSTFIMTGGECVVASISFDKGYDNSVLETAVRATTDSGLSYFAITIPQSSATYYRNDPSSLFGETCWDDAKDVSTAGIFDYYNGETEGGNVEHEDPDAAPIVVDLTLTSSEYLSRSGAVRSIATSAVRCKLDGGTYYVVVKATEAVTVTLTASVENAPEWLCNDATLVQLILFWFLGIILGCTLLTICFWEKLCPWLFLARRPP